MNVGVENPRNNNLPGNVDHERAFGLSKVGSDGFDSAIFDPDVGTRGSCIFTGYFATFEKEIHDV